MLTRNIAGPRPPRASQTLYRADPVAAITTSGPTGEAPRLTLERDGDQPQAAACSWAW